MTGLSLEAAKKARTKKHWAKYKNKRRPASHTVEKEGKLVLPKTKYLRLKISKIKTRPDQIADPNVASSVAESWVAVPQIHPVIVRKLGEGKYELVWGADVIAAAAAAELSVIECQIFKGTKEEARLVQVAEALFRKELTALEQAEHWVEWAEGVLKAKGLFSGQPVAKRGRPEGKLLKAAQLLPAYGERTLAARKKMLERAYKIAGLPSDVKEAIKKAGLDNNGSALLAIASSGREAEAQHRKLNKIVEKISDLAELESPPLQPDGDFDAGSDETPGDRNAEEDDDSGDDQGEDDGDDHDGDDDSGEGNGGAEKEVDTDLQKLREFWKEHGGVKLWAHTPSSTRKEFVDWLASRPCRAESDIAPYILDVFAGRQKIEVRVLKAHAESRGLSLKQLRKYLKLHGYQRQKVGSDPGTPWEYRNSDRSFAAKVSSVTKKKLNAPFEAELTALQKAAEKTGQTNLDRGKKPGDDYYDV